MSGIDQTAPVSGRAPDSDRLPHSRPTPSRFIIVTHGGANVTGVTTMNILATVFPISAGLMLYGWRALGVMSTVVVGALIASIVWKRIGRRGAQLRYDHIIGFSLLLALMLPAHLFSRELWPILPAGSILLVVFTWLLGGVGSGRVHPVLASFLVLMVFFQDSLQPTYVLRWQSAFLGDVLNATPLEPSTRFTVPWIARNVPDPFDATKSTPPATQLETFTGGRLVPERDWTSLEALLRDRMPPLEDLMLGGQPAPIGLSSAVAVIIGGLFLLYRGLIDFRVPLIATAVAFACFLILPVPLVITESSQQWSWFIGASPNVGWAVALTFANYELLATPLLFTVFFLATAPAVRPLVRRARVIYAIMLAVLASALQLYVSANVGAYLALLAVSLLAPLLDRLFRPRTLV
jgi:electron transport complex protein RnfD